MPFIVLGQSFSFFSNIEEKNLRKTKQTLKNLFYHRKMPQIYTKIKNSHF